MIFDLLCCYVYLRGIRLLGISVMMLKRRLWVEKTMFIKQMWLVIVLQFIMFIISDLVSTSFQLQWPQQQVADFTLRKQSICVCSECGFSFLQNIKFSFCFQFKRSLNWIGFASHITLTPSTLVYNHNHLYPTVIYISYYILLLHYLLLYNSCNIIGFLITARLCYFNWQQL